MLSRCLLLLSAPSPSTRSLAISVGEYHWALGPSNREIAGVAHALRTRGGNCETRIDRGRGRWRQAETGTDRDRETETDRGR
eukprot:749579-Hanusia_phi.AAC.4